ncbi:AAA family ATPase [Alkalispirochaeta alkalica]|uniref:AAA family ATPase n=1 Tax=Alkalispirochaeta alkalica TaxID=46356 RepID=UPI0003602B5D|nr:AAA family ATPase [Alkalispirochaeta alkalica]
MKQADLSVKERIAVLIRARYPLVYVVSSEEKRVEDTMKEIARERGKRCFVWSITKGLECDDGTRLSDLREPLKVLDYIMELDVKGLFVVKDFHPFLNDPVVVRKLRDVNGELKTTVKNVLLLSSILKIPPEMEKEISVVDYDLPGKDEIGGIIDGICRSVGGDPTGGSERNREKIVDAALGLTAEEAENVFAKSLVQTGHFDVGIILSEKEQIIRKSGVLEYYQAQEEMAEIGGLEYLKEWLKKRSLAFTDEAREFGLPQPKGVLLIGIPGCGKSLTAKAISSLWQIPLLKLDMGKVFSSLVGSSEENVRKAIRTAESIAPSILWLDELEKGFAGMGGGSSGDSGTSARVFGTFLTWLQEKKSAVFVVATSNDISALPPELLRKGRFDEIFYIDLPNRAEREEIFRIHLEKRKRDPQNFSLDLLSRQTTGYSGSEIEEVVISSLYDAFDKHQDISTEGLQSAASSMIPLSQTMGDRISEIREWAKLRARRASLQCFEEDESKDRLLELT